jgi:hypothetical protein
MKIEFLFIIIYTKMGCMQSIKKACRCCPCCVPDMNPILDWRVLTGEDKQPVIRTTCNGYAQFPNQGLDMR